MRGLAVWTFLMGCACSSKPPIGAVPVVIFTECGFARTQSPLHEHPEWCLYVELHLADAGVVQQWPMCGPSLCSMSEGHGFVALDGNGQLEKPVATYCLAPLEQPISVTLCIPSFEPLTVTSTPHPIARGADAWVLCSDRQYDTFSFQQQQIWYRLRPRDGGAGDDGGCPAPPATWSKQASCCELSP